jgi:chromosome segregation ATPase
LFGRQKSLKKIFKTQDSREVLFTEPSDSFDFKKSNTRTNLESEKVRLAKERLKRINKAASSSDLLKDQDYIIKLQNNLIDNLRNEISLIAKDKRLETEEFGEKFKKNTIEEDNETYIEEYENEITRLKKTIKRKDDIIKEINAEMDLTIQKKDSKIKKLEETIESLKSKEKNNQGLEIEEIKKLMEFERKEKGKVEKENLELKEQVRVVTEENKILIQNYEEVRRRFFEHEKVLNPVKTLLSKMTSSKYELQNIPGFIENLCSHNKNLNEKAKLLNEKCKSLEEENSNMKLAYSKQQKKMKELKLKFSDSDETLIDKLRRKSIKIVELKKMLGHQNSRSKLKVSEINTNVSDYSVIESQMSVIEEELNLLKTENRILISKENDLCSKLKNSEKARYYYQEQTIGLKEKVNSLENHLKMLESSVLELKAVKDSPDYQNQFKRS